MQFSEKFISLREALQAQSDPAFSHMCNVTLCDRPVALHSTVRIDTKVKILGVIETKEVAYSAEQRVFALEPQPLTADSLKDWWEFGHRFVDECLVIEAGHQFSMMSLLLACPKVDWRVGFKLRRLSYEPRYKDGVLGWSSLRLGVIDLSTGKVYTNSIGTPLADILKKAWNG